MRILIVEDEEALAIGLQFNFEQEGYDVLLAGDGPTALKFLRDATPAEPIDLVILDVMLPGMSGYEVCRELRQFDQLTPVLMLTARTLSEDRAHGFDVGTDQYMSKPFALPELLSRVRNLIERRKAMQVSMKANSAGLTVVGADDEEDDEEPEKPTGELDLYCFGNVTVNFQTFELTQGDRLYNLTTLEMQLLRYFIQHEGRVLSRTQILENVWDISADVTTRTVDNFVLRLRKLIEPDPAQPRYIRSVRGTGYRFVSSGE